MSDFAKVLIPVLVGAVVALIGASAAWFTYFATHRYGTRSSQISYIQTIFQYEVIPRYFSYILWNVHFLSNMSHFFKNLVIDDQGLAKIQNTDSHSRIIIEILSYVSGQSTDIASREKKGTNDSLSLDSFLSNTPLVRNRLSNPDIIAEFKSTLSSKGNGHKELRERLNQFIRREKLRMCERTSYMSFLLPFACLPKFRQRIVGLIDDRNIQDSERWPKIEETIERFLQGSKLPR